MTGQQWPPPPPPGPSGHYPGLPPCPPASGRPRRRHSRWLTIGLPVGVVLFLGACAAAITLVVTTLIRDIGPAQHATEAYAKALVDQRFADAQRMMCARDRAGISPAALAEHYFRPQLTGYQVDGVNVTNVNGELSARATVRFTTADGIHSATTLLLVKEGGTWRPCP